MITRDAIAVLLLAGMCLARPARAQEVRLTLEQAEQQALADQDRKSTRLNSSH